MEFVLASIKGKHERKKGEGKWKEGKRDLGLRGWMKKKREREGKKGAAVHGARGERGEAKMRG